MSVRETCEVEGDEIVLRIPISALPVGAQIAWERHAAGRQELRIIDARRFAEEMRHCLLAERENGDTLITDMLDRAAVQAVEYGAEGCELQPSRRR